MAARPRRRGYAGVDDSIIELIAIIGIILVALTLVLTAAFAEEFGSSTVLTLAKAIMPGLVILGVVLYGRRTIYMRERDLEDGAVIAIVTVAGFTAIVLATIVAILVGSNSVQNNLKTIILDSLPITGVVVGAVVGFGAGGALRSRRETDSERTESSGRFGSVTIIFLSVVVAFTIIGLALIVAIVTGDSDVPSALTDLIDELAPVIGALAGVALGFIGGMSVPLPSRAEEAIVADVEQESVEQMEGPAPAEPTPGDPA